MNRCFFRLNERLNSYLILAPYFLILFNIHLTKAQAGISVEYCSENEYAELFAPYSDEGYYWIHNGETSSAIKIGKEFIGKKITCIVKRKRKCDCDCDDKYCGIEAIQFDRIITASDFKGMTIQPAIKHLSCYESNDGQISIQAAGSFAPYQFSWEDGSNESVRTHLSAGKYKVTITNDIYCKRVLTINLNQPQRIDTSKIAIQITAPNCKGDSTGRIAINALEGDLNSYSFNWSNGHSGSSLAKVPVGTYHVQIRNDNSCIYEKIDIEEPAVLHSSLIANSDFNGSDTRCHNSKDGSVDIKVLGGHPPYEILWNESKSINIKRQESFSISNLRSGLYTVHIKDAKGCKQTDTIKLENPAPIQASLRLSDYNGYHIKCFSESNGSIESVVTGGTGNYQYNWTGNNGFKSSAKDLTNLSSGIYHLTIQDENGCEFKDQVKLKSPRKVRLLTEVKSLFLSKKYKVKVRGTGGVGPYKIDDTANDSKSFRIKQTKIRRIILEDANGCKTEKIHRVNKKKLRKNKKFFLKNKYKKKKWRGAYSNCPKF